ncbi:MAG: PEP-CTERM sorting domain-containing protein [Accumulibacter sp.]|jgi:hypothetical protein|uniref:PEP-CTERM sorting domain-containing protein n=1 Tax=Accumulibacter sp. TaxID=2053492 RepID=UPI002FC3805E
MKPTNEPSRVLQAGKSTRTFARNLAGAIALFGAVGMTQAGVVDPTQPVAGSTQLQLAEQWLQWALSIDAASNPMLDTTGAYAHVNNLGPVFFVAGNTGGSSTRTFTAPAGKPIFFPIVTAYDIEVPADNCDLQCAFGYIPGVGNATGLYATLDGQDLLTFPSYRQTSTAFFTVDLSASLSAALGFPPQYAGILDAIVDGYWVAVEGLTPGPHTLKFGGSIPDLAPGWTPPPVDVTDTVNVPEPGTLGLLLLAAVAASARRRPVATDAVSVGT